MNAKRLWAWVGLAAIILAVLLVAGPQEQIAIVIAGSALAAIAAVISARSARAFIQRHPPLIRIAGVVTLIAATALLALGVTDVLRLSADVLGPVFAGLLMAGFLMLRLPEIARGAEAALERAGASAEPASIPGEQTPLGEVLAIMRELVSERRALLKVVGPWFLIACAVPLAFIDAEFWKTLVGDSRVAASQFLLGLLLALVIDVAVIFIGLIQWMRYLATRHAPAFTDVPIKAAWGWFWRWFLYSSILRQVDGLEPWLKERLPTLSLWQSLGVQTLLVGALLLLLSPLALIFPAVALGAPDKSIGWGLQARQSEGRRFFAVTALILAPWLMALWAFAALSETRSSPPSSLGYVLLGFMVLLFLVTLLSAATYLTKVHLRAIARSL